MFFEIVEILLPSKLFYIIYNIIYKVIDQHIIYVPNLT